MLLQSHEDLIRVFPATPTNWHAAFTLKARGGFLVSARMETNGQLPFVLIRSELGNTCRLANPWLGTTVVVEAPGQAEERVSVRTDEQVIAFPTKPGASYRVRSAGASPDNASAAPVTFTGSPNPGPKRYHEALLGKPRDF
jgi:hypothetical protein